MKKLDSMFTGLRTFPVSTLEHHNQRVDGLYNGFKFTSWGGLSMMQFACILSRLGTFSDTIGNIYGLLSWQIFKTEEGRLVNEEGMSPNFAAKQVRISVFAYLSSLNFRRLIAIYPSVDESEND